MEVLCEADASNPAQVEKNAEAIKQRGNEHFMAKRHKEAVECYSQAISLSASNHVLYGNRSAAHGGLGAWALAAADARRSVEIEPGYTKGFYRLAQALIALDESAEAESAIENGLRADPAANKEMAALKRRIAGSRRRHTQQVGKGAVAATGGGGGVPKKAAKSIDLGRAGLYDDKEAPDNNTQDQQANEAGSLKALFSSLRDSIVAASSNGSLGNGPARHDLDGVFSKLIEPEQFRRIALSRLPEDERRQAPSSFQELLRTPLYASALEKALPRVVSTAASVLEGVKRRGREQGDIMDSATEEALKPQVLQEAFAREVIGVITMVQATARAQAVIEAGKVASPVCEEASWDQLHDTTVADLSRRGRRFSVQDSFLGEEWVSPLLEDSARFQAAGKLHPLGLEPEHGEMAWVEPDNLEFGFPALHELVVNLHALAFELNLKDPKLGLRRAFQGSTMLLRLTEGCRVPVRLDSVAGGAETGHKISAVYFVGRKGGSDADKSQQALSEEGDAINAGGQLRLKNMETNAPLAEGIVGGSSGNASPLEGNPPQGREEVNTSTLDGSRNTDVNGGGSAPDGLGFAGPRGGKGGEESTVGQGAVVELEPTADRLVMFRSDCVSTQTLEVLGHEREQYAMLFWMHGARGGAGDVAGGDGGGGLKTEAEDLSPSSQREDGGEEKDVGKGTGL
ncbi:conserved unknown protein [Ectocarpus siliculosus]|uniref:Uncharacterized protein n=1 Tax=Ectocarpus siliculosus TaxID=2880 RepID=D7G815_ECTSI|nr:conserved unknown protein [Ectocarpus siliculosus]|eukprot:CBJ27890.1 conserved unknown protein [Ectocarpus siliculosus]